MKDLRVFLPVLLLTLIVFLISGCGGVVPSPGATEEDVTTISGQIKMPLFCCDTLSSQSDSLTRDESTCDESDLWTVTPDAIIELKSAEKGKCNKLLDTTIADDSGYYTFEDVKPGLYIITAFCPVEGDEGFLVKDVAEKVYGEALDAGIPDCTSTGLALVIEMINDCYDDYYQCFNKFSATYKMVKDIASDVGTVDIPAIMAHDDFGDYCDDEDEDLVDVICAWTCCVGAGATGGGGPTPNPCAGHTAPYDVDLDPKNAIAGQLYTGTVTAEDEDDDELTFAFNDDYDPPGDMAITPDGVITWTPTEGDICYCSQPVSAGQQERATDNGHSPCSPIKVTVSDRCDSVDAEFCVEVGCPSLCSLAIGIDDATVCDDICAVIGPVTISFDDGTADLVINNLEDTRLVWDTTPTGISFDKSSGKVCLTCENLGPYTLGVTYTDACGATVHGTVDVTFELCCPELSKLELCVTIPDTLCQDDCATVNSATVSYGDGTSDLIITDLSTLDWTYEADELDVSFNSDGTANICLADGAALNTQYSIYATYTDECDVAVDSAPVLLTFEACCDELIVDAGPDQCIQLDCASEAVVGFDGSGSSGTDLTYEWDFNDEGALGTGETTSHTYSAGTYNVTLTVTDACGNSDSDTMELTIYSACGNLPAQLTVSDSSTFNTDGHYLKVEFSDGSGDISSNAWYYGWCAHNGLDGIPISGDVLNVYCTPELDTYWPNVNWIVNNTSGYTKMQVQYAIWYFIHHNGEDVDTYVTNLPSWIMGGPSSSDRTKIKSLINAAADETDFCPGIGDKYLVLLTFDPLDSYGDLYKGPRCDPHEQNIMIELVRVDHCACPPIL